MKKKTAPKTEEQIKRSKKIRTYLLAAIAVMALIIYLLPHKEVEEKENNPITDKMEKTLDSLIRTQGITEYEISYLGKIEETTEIQIFDEEDSLAIIEMRIQMIQKMPGLTDRQRIQKLEKELTKRDSLENVLTMKMSEPQDNNVHTRRVRIITEDGKKYAFFQRLKNGNVSMKYFIETTNIDQNNPPTF